jgi:hypothetical protein
MDIPGPTTSVGTMTNGGPMGLLDLCYTTPDGVGRKDYGGGLLR